MDRRDFLKLSAAMGISLTSPLVGRSANAQTPFSGPFLVTIQAEGGWDPTMLCDPKGQQGANDPSPINNLFEESQIENAGNIHYAPIGNNQSFFQKFYDRLYVLNGIQTGTNNHDTGQMLAWSGEGQRTTAITKAASMNDPSMSAITTPIPTKARRATVRISPVVSRVLTASPPSRTSTPSRSW